MVEVKNLYKLLHVVHYISGSKEQCVRDDIHFGFKLAIIKRMSSIDVLSSTV